MSSTPSQWWVYVLHSQAQRFGKRGEALTGFYYVGSTTDPVRRLRQHNGEIVGGARYTAKHRPWILAAVFGPYPDRSTAFKAEMTLKRTKKSVSRTLWSLDDSPYAIGDGRFDQRVLSAGTSGDADHASSRPDTQTH